MTKTATDFARAAAEHGITWWPIRTCSICNVPVGFVIEHGHVAWRSACGCSSFGGWSPRTWDDIADHYNRQTAPEVVAGYATFWRFDTAQEGTTDGD